MLSCFVIDDERGAIDILETFIEKTPFLKLIGSTVNPLEAWQTMRTQKIDVVFLDIQMPYITGLEMMNIIQDRSKVILTTAYSDHALEGFEKNALDYLLKPFAFERFLKATQKALAANVSVPTTRETAENVDSYIFVKTENKGKMIKINFDDIMYVEGLKNYVSIYTKNDRVITLLNIKDFEERLSQKRFLRVHKSYLVSLEKIRAVDGNQILMSDMKAYIPLGETYRSSFFDSLRKSLMDSKR